MPDTKYCVDCKFFYVPTSGSIDYQCRREENRDLVTGDKVIVGCRTERETIGFGKCGPIGQFWERKLNG